MNENLQLKLAEKQQHLKMVTYTERWPGLDLADEDMVALFDDRRIEAEEVLRQIEAGGTSYHPAVLIMSAEQARNVLDLDV